MPQQYFTDQMGHTLAIEQPVLRIVSLVPSQSELLADLGLAEKLAGITKFCIHPKELKTAVQQIGGTKTVKIDEVLALKPDVVIGNKEENAQADIEALQQQVPVWMSDITDLDSALDMIDRIGELTGTTAAAEEMVEEIRLRFAAIRPVLPETKLSVLYLIWRKPYMAAGKGTFIDDCLTRCGWENCLSETRYPEVEVAAVNPDVILLSSEPYPFADKHIAELQELFPKARIVLVDGEYFSWYGSRMLGAPAYFREVLEQIEPQG